MEKTAVMKMLGISEEQYNTIYFDTAMEYLERICDGHEQIRSELHQTPAFWNWWKVQYRLLDEQILKQNRKMVVNLYYDLHAFMQHLPDRVVYRAISDGYRDMIGDVIRQATRKES